MQRSKPSCSTLHRICSECNGERAHKLLKILKFSKLRWTFRAGQKFVINNLRGHRKLERCQLDRSVPLLVRCPILWSAVEILKKKTQKREFNFEDYRWGLGNYVTNLSEGSGEKILRSYLILYNGLYFSKIKLIGKALFQKRHVNSTLYLKMLKDTIRFRLLICIPLRHGS